MKNKHLKKAKLYAPFSGHVTVFPITTILSRQIELNQQLRHLSTHGSGLVNGVQKRILNLKTEYRSVKSSYGSIPRVTKAYY